MNRQLANKTHWWSSLFSRVKLACQALVAPKHVVEATVGQLVSYDAVNRRLVIQGDFSIHSTGSILLSADQHVLVMSGNEAGEYTHEIHLNPSLENLDDIYLELNQPGSVGQSNLQSNDGSESLAIAADHGSDHICAEGEATPSTTG